MAKISKAQLKVYISETSPDVKNVDPKYVLDKRKIDGEDSIVFEVSELIKDYIDVYYDGSISRAKNSIYVRLELNRTFDDDTTDTQIQKGICTLGYGYQAEGINPHLSSDILTSNRTFFVPAECRESSEYPVRIPFYTIGKDGITSIQYVDEAGQTIDKKSTTTIIKLTADSTIYTADDVTDEITADRTFITSTSSIFTETDAPPGTEVVKFTGSNGIQQQVTIKYLKERKYKPYRITFINKFGAFQDLFFFKARKDSHTLTRTGYQKSILEVKAEGADYSIYKHQSHLLDVDGIHRFSMNTGFVTEDHNEVIKQLLLTENAWIYEDNVTKPVKAVQSNFDEKFEVNEKLINFTVDFEYANSTVQNVR
jgi:hypothetical protein